MKITFELCYQLFQLFASAWGIFSLLFAMWLKYHDGNTPEATYSLLLAILLLMPGKSK